MDLAWFGGFFDGDGCVAIRKINSSRENYRCGASISQRDNRPLEKFLVRWGGTIDKWVNTKRGAYFWGWQINGQEALQFLKDIYPYTTVKKREIALAIEFLELGEHRRGIPPEVLIKRREFYRRYRDIKDEQKEYSKCRN